MKEPILFSSTDPSAGTFAQTPTVSIATTEGQRRFAFHPIREGGKCFDVNFLADRNSTLEVVVLQDAPAGSDLRIRLHAIAKEGATLKLTIVQKGASRSLVDLFSEASGAGSMLEVRALHVAADGQRLHFHAETRHPVPGTSSDLQVWNAARGDSRTLFRGLIRIEKGARQTEAFQRNRNLILSERAVIDSIPKLLIANDDVKCAHGSSTSSLDPDQEVYLQSRGIDRMTAEKMLVNGFIAQALDSIGDEECRKGISSLFGLGTDSWAPIEEGIDA
jgi:Fe-S cluster assembly protein SufD